MPESTEVLTVSVVNQSAMPPSKFKKVFAALQFQIERDWNTSAWVKAGFAPKCQLVQNGEGAHTLTFIQNAAGYTGDGEGGEAWHTEGLDGSLKGYVNYGQANATGVSSCALGSHELVEMLVRGKLGSPTAYREIVDPVTGDTWRAEPADPVVDTLYEVLGQQVSDFCEPAWYGLDDGLPFAWYTCRQSLTAPHELGPHGYAEVQRAGTTGFTQLTG